MGGGSGCRSQRALLEGLRLKYGFVDPFDTSQG